MPTVRVGADIYRSHSFLRCCMPYEYQRDFKDRVPITVYIPKDVKSWLSANFNSQSRAVEAMLDNSDKRKWRGYVRDKRPVDKVRCVFWLTEKMATMLRKADNFQSLVVQRVLESNYKRRKRVL